jgi:hypothetical protein
MERVNDLPILLSLFGANVPTLLVCVVAGIVIVGRWQQGSSVSFWAALGFGLLLVLCFVIPLGQMMLRQWVFEPGELQTRAWAFTVFSVAASVLHAIIYACLLAAIFVGRPKADGV